MRLLRVIPALTGTAIHKESNRGYLVLLVVLV